MTQRDDIRAEIAATFAKARAEIDQAERRALALLGVAIDRPELPPTDESEWTPAWGRLGDAEKLLGCTRNTALRKVVLHGLGHVVDRRWQVDLNRIRALQAKQPFPPLPRRNW